MTEFQGILPGIFFMAFWCATRLWFLVMREEHGWNTSSNAKHCAKFRLNKKKKLHIFLKKIDKAAYI
jgi:hypothetical protein